MRAARLPACAALLGLLVACAPEAPTPRQDLDGDGYRSGKDCDDGSAGISPEAEERCNGIDDDCDGEIDEAGSVDGIWAFIDMDSDGIGGGEPTLLCPGEEGVSLIPGDCEDQDFWISPRALERCDGVDNDCDGVIDEAGAVDAEPWPLDRDQDGYGHPTQTGLACGPGDGFAEDATDCDDADPTRSPGAPEVCENGQDDDCDLVVDEEGDALTPTWFLDADGDGYGSESTLSQCSAPLGYAALDNDCDDTNPDVHPEARDDDTDDIDNDCDGEIDERGDSVGDGRVRYGPSSFRTSCRMVWSAHWEEISPTPFGDYAWRAEQVLDTSESRTRGCTFAMPAEDFTWTVAWVFHGADLFSDMLWVQEEDDGRWVPLLPGNLRRSSDSLSFEQELESSGGGQITFEGEIDFIGL